MFVYLKEIKKQKTGKKIYVQLFLNKKNNNYNNNQVLDDIRLGVNIIWMIMLHAKSVQAVIRRIKRRGDN